MKFFVSIITNDTDKPIEKKFQKLIHPVSSQIVLSALVAVALAKPHAVVPLAYAHVLPGAPIGPDGRVVDTPEVAVAKAEHAAAHINEKVTLAHEAVKSADVVAYAAAPAVVSAYSAPAVVSAYSAYSAPAVVSSYAAPHLVRVGHGAAPTGIDGRVVDTPEVAVAKAEHAAAHINEKVTLAHEAAKNYASAYAPAVVSAYSAPAVVPAAYSAYSAPVLSAYSAPAVVSAYSAPAVVSAYSSYAHSAVPAVSVW